MLRSFYRNKKILITGHTGFKGAWLTQWLLSMGAQVIGYSNHDHTDPSLFELLKFERNLIDVRGDIRNAADTQAVIDAHRPDVVIHMAAQALVRRSYHAPVDTFSTNVMGTVNVLEAVRKTPGILATLIVTTDKCYENLEQGRAYLETDRLGGKDPYSASKACAELATAAYFHSYLSHGEQNLTRLLSARAGNVIGGGDWAEDRIVPDCVRAWSKHEPIVLRSPHAVRPWQHVLEPLSGYLQAIVSLCTDKKFLHGHAFNFGPGADSNRTVADLVHEMKKHWPEGQMQMQIQNSNSTGDQLPAQEAHLLHLNCEKADIHLRWKSVLTFEQSVAMTAQWYRGFYVENKEARELTQSQIDFYEDIMIRGKV